MKLILAFAMTTAVAAGCLPHSAQAAGCLSGGAVGGVAGHAAGHHAVLGAAAGCAVGHHMNATKQKNAAASSSQPAAQPQ